MDEQYIIEHFWDELETLHREKPRVCLGTYVNENSDFSNFTDGCKDSYLVFNAWNNEDCMYARSLVDSQDCVDCSYVRKSTLCYEVIDCVNCYNSAFLQQCEDCRDCTYGYDLKACSNCFGCVGLRHKEFHVFNEPCTPEEYREQVGRIRDDEDFVWGAFRELQTQVPRLFVNNVNVEHCIGDHVRNSKGCFACYETQDCRDCLYCLEVTSAHDMCDVEFGEYGSFNYECISAWKLQGSQYCTFCWESSDVEYCENVFRSEHCFGCVFLNHRKFCILNQQFEREDYFRLKEEIIAKMKADGTYGRKFLGSTYPIEDTVAVMKV